MLETLGSAFIFLGIALFFIGIILILSAKNKTKVEAGGAVFIGPFPLFFGATSKTMLLIVSILSVAFLLMVLLLMIGVVRW